MIQFEDKDLLKLDLNNSIEFANIFVHYLGGKKGLRSEDLSEKNLKILKKIKDEINKKGLNYEQLNEILLFFNQNRVSRGFYSFFFKQKEIITIKELIKGIADFRGYCLLHYGNFKNSFRIISRMGEHEIQEIFRDYLIKSSELEDNYKNRPKPLIDIDEIEKDKTWYLGYISGLQLELESSRLNKVLNEPNIPNLENYEEFRNKLLILDNEIKKYQEQGILNTRTYLIWDYIDIYIATSMRNKNEYIETREFLTKIINHNKLKLLNLRFFDPTQSYCSLLRDKGLIEGLMLKRAKCTIYMVQENDTMGKDSEMASTLAQKKPVIAFIPKYNFLELFNKIKDFELEEIKKRIHLFEAEKLFNEKKILDKLYDLKIEKILNSFLRKYKIYRINQEFTLWNEKEEQFKKKFKKFDDLCRILTETTLFHLKHRARNFKKGHPLGMQIDLDSGVANGVLVVRDWDMCAELLFQILTNSLSFFIKHKKKGFTGLFERNTKSIFRIVTDDETLTNSFWNFFYKI